MIFQTRLKTNFVNVIFAVIICLGTESKESSESLTHDPADDYTIYDSDTQNLGESGEFLCEGHGLDEAACEKLGCCSWDDGECWSAVGTRSCSSAKGLGKDSVPMGESNEDSVFADMIEEKQMSVRDAQLYCNKLPRCLGFMFEGHVPKDDKLLRIIFKSGSHIVNSGWATFIHKGIEVSQSVPPVYRFRGKLKSLQSQAPLDAEELYTGAIMNLIGTTFKEVTQNQNKDVLVNVYAPWCGFCQKFKRQYGQLAENLRHVQTLQITQMDGTQNQVADFPVGAFPTVVLFPAGEKKDQPLKYVGNRQPEDITHWLHQHATNGDFADFPVVADAKESESDGILGDAADL